MKTNTISTLSTRRMTWNLIRWVGKKKKILGFLKAYFGGVGKKKLRRFTLKFVFHFQIELKGG